MLRSFHLVHPYGATFMDGGNKEGLICFSWTMEFRHIIHSLAELVYVVVEPYSYILEASVFEIRSYYDMTPESRSSPLLENGSPKACIRGNVQTQ
jgi:hypothetical protein